MGKVEKLNTHTNAKKTDSKSCGNKELIKRYNVKNSPFEIITTEMESFGVMGQYRLTEIYKTKEEVEKELEGITWNRIIQVIMLLTEINEKNKNITK